MTERFKKIPFPIHRVSASSPEELFKLLPGLKRYFHAVPTGITDMADIPEKHRATPIDIVKIIRYIIFLYDPDSDLLFEYSDDVRLRKEAALREAGFTRQPNGEWPQHVVDVMDFKNEYVLDWVLDYLKVRNRPLYTEIVVTEEELDMLYRQRLQNIKAGEIKGPLMALTKERQDQVSLLKKKFFSDHSDVRDKGEEKMFPIKPENVFKELRIDRHIYQLRQIKDVSGPAKLS